MDLDLDNVEIGMINTLGNIRIYVEDLQMLQEVQDTRWNQAERNDLNKTCETLLFSYHRNNPVWPHVGHPRMWLV